MDSVQENYYAVAWCVVLVLIVLCTLYFMLYKPMKNNAVEMTRLTLTMQNLIDELKKEESAIDALWRHEHKQDEKIIEISSQLEIHNHILNNSEKR